MLDKMADGLFQHLERKMYKITDDFKGATKTYLSRQKNHEPENAWKLIYD
jgi:hypothetical protein